MKFYILVNRQPTPTEDIEEWNKFFIDIKNRRVGLTELEKIGVRVSTVFMGTQITFNTGVFFETMVFGGYYDGLVRCYQTWAEAELGHNIVVEMVNKVPKMIHKLPNDNRR